MQPTGFREQFTAIADAWALAQGIVDTVREPVLVLDKELRVIAASRSFYSAFKVSPEDTQGRLLYALGDGQWDIPKLRVLLEKIIPEKGVMEGYEVEHEFPGLGHRTMRLNARQVFYEGGANMTILLGIEDVTARRILEREKDELLRQKDMLLEELQHRVANSLQIIASILLMKARAVQSEETRLHLKDAHKRVLSVAAVQKQLHASGATGSIEIAPYLTQLCESLATSMIGDTRPISLKVVGEGGSATSRQAESLGLIVTELVMNALKHAFPDEKAKGQITVAYDMAGTNWKLSISDNGVGKPDGVFAHGKSGLGTGIIKALSQQLDAQVETLAGPGGTTVSITHATFPTKDDPSRLNGGRSSLFVSLQVRIPIVAFAVAVEDEGHQPHPQPQGDEDAERHGDIAGGRHLLTGLTFARAPADNHEGDGHDQERHQGGQHDPGADLPGFGGLHGRSLRMQFSKKACQSLYHRRAASDGGWRRGAPYDRADHGIEGQRSRALRRSMRTSMTSSTRMPMVRSGNTAFSQIDTSGVDHAQALR